MTTDDARTVQMTEASTRIADVREMTGDAIFGAMSRDMLAKVAAGLDNTNGDFKVQNCAKVIFANYLSHFKDVERNMANIKQGMSSATKVALVKTYGNEKGEIQWSMVRGAIEVLKRRIDEQSGANAAYAAAVPR